MSTFERTHLSFSWVWVAAFLGAAGLGVLAGINPALAIAAAAGIGLVVIVAVDLTFGLIVFVYASFIDVIQLQNAALTGVKGLGLILALAWLAAVATRRAGTRRHIVVDHFGFVCVVGAFVAWSLLSVSWAASPSSALSSTGRYALDAFLIPIVYSAITKPKHLRWFAVAFVIGALLSTAYGLEAGLGTDASRVSGAVGDSNETAAVLVAAAVFAFALCGERRWGPAMRLLAFLAGLGSVVGLAMTASRGGLVALAAAGLVAVMLAGRWRGRAVVALALVSIAVVGWFAAFAPAGARDRVVNASSDGRSTIWAVAERVIEAHPVLGVGSDNFVNVSANYLDQPGLTAAAWFILDQPKVAHNLFLETWADLGTVGLLLWLAMLAYAMRCGLQAIRVFAAAGRRNEEIFARSYVIAYSGMLVADFFISAVYSKQLWLLIALGPALLSIAKHTPADLGEVAI